MKLRNDIDIRKAEEAAEWLYRLRDTDDLACRRAFTAWLKQSPHNMHEFLMTAAVFTELDAVDPERRMDVEELIEAARARPMPLPGAAARPNALPDRKRGRLPAALAAAFCLVVAGLISWRIGLAPTYSTATGEQRSLKLEDGSIIYLNTRSSVRVNYTSKARDISLETGEALFTVAHDPARPFRVFAGDAIVRAVGTQFNVLRRPDETRVAVVEGQVQVSTSPEALARSVADVPGSVQLSAGEQATVLSGGNVHTHAADPESSTAWRQRRLVFRDAELSEIAAEFNRYNRTPQFRVVGEAVAERRYTGTFNADDPESLAQLLGAERDLVLVSAGDEVLIQAAQSR